jgi:hypothetical protein
MKLFKFGGDVPFDHYYFWFVCGNVTNIMISKCEKINLHVIPMFES